MPVSDIQLNLIFRYFDDDLSAEEEEELLQEVQQNEELQQSFDQQILMQQFQPDEVIEPVVSTATESADDFLKRVTHSMEAGQASTPVKPLPAVKRNKIWMAAAAVVIGVLALSIYFINRNKGDNTVVKVPGKDSIAQTKQPTPKKLQDEPTPEPAVNLRQLYADNYSTFSGSGLDVPPAAMTYESDYKQRNYQKLANLSESILGTKGTRDPAEEAETANYFYFYKALAALQVDDTTTAQKLLKKLLTGSAGNTELSNPVKWYLLMAYLKSNNKPEALMIATSIASNKSSKYQKQAAQIQQILSK